MLQEFTQQVEDTARAVMNEIHTALPGNVLSFNPSTGTATVKPEGKYVLSNGKKLDYPTITEVPVVFPYCQSGGVGVAFPVVKGDSCIIIISEVELDEWRSGAESEAPLRFDLSSALCIPGLLDGGSDLVQKANKKNAVVIGAGDVEITVTSDEALVDTGSTQLSVTDSGVEITGNVKVKGNLTCTGVMKTNTSLNLNEHTHVSAAPGSDTGKPK